MFELLIGSNTNRERKVISLTTTLKQALIDAGIDVNVGTIHLDGASLKPGDINKTFADFGVTDKATLISVVKADAAM